MLNVHAALECYEAREISNIGFEHSSANLADGLTKEMMQKGLFELIHNHRLVVECKQWTIRWLRHNLVFTRARMSTFDNTLLPNALERYSWALFSNHHHHISRLRRTHTLTGWKPWNLNEIMWSTPNKAREQSLLNRKARAYTNSKFDSRNPHDRLQLGSRGWSNSLRQLEIIF